MPGRPHSTIHQQNRVRDGLTTESHDRWAHDRANIASALIGSREAGRREYVTRNVVMPMVIWSPLCSGDSAIKAPFTSVPLLEFRSSRNSRWSRRLSLQWTRLDQVSRMQISASSPRPIVTGSSVRMESEADGTASIQVKCMDIAASPAGEKGEWWLACCEAKARPCGGCLHEQVCRLGRSRVVGTFGDTCSK
jgi:hypothetical protein